MRIATINALALFVAPIAISNTIKLYEDPVTGQVFTKPGDGRVKVEYPLDPQEKAETADPTQAAAPAMPVTKDMSGIDANPINNITILNPKSPEFPLGKETRVNMKFVPQDAPDMYFQAGVRIQGSFENTQRDYKDPAITDTNLNDVYLRRARLEVGAGFGKHTSFKMDIRSDRVNQFFRDEGEFRIGDAYLKISKPFDTSLVNFRLYRAKIDVSRTQTVKSAYVVAYDRPLVADAAAQFISFNRRAANVQIYGDWKKKIHYQLAAGDAVQENELRDLAGISTIEVTDQSLFYGGKIIFSPINGWEELKKTETYMGQGKHFSVGAAYWTVPQIKGETDANNAAFDLNHELINLEASLHYKGFFIQSEFFKFKDVVENWDAPVLNVGESDGWYVTGEYVLTNFHYIAPFARYETWDRFEGKQGSDVTSALVGVNWYLRGNTTKVGLVYQRTESDESIGDLGAVDLDSIRITSQFFF